jgi:uncharacterized MAPEG superfamily protein
MDKVSGTHGKDFLSVPLWVLLGFAAWTLATLTFSVGVYRWSRIFTGRASVSEWRADRQQGSEWYQRAMRAHQNCVENLPVYTALVVALLASGTSGAIIDGLALAILVARVCQTLVHLCLRQTDLVASARFIFFLVQVVAMAWIGIIIAVRASA